MEEEVKEVGRVRGREEEVVYLLKFGRFLLSLAEIIRSKITNFVPKCRSAE